MAFIGDWTHRKFGGFNSKMYAHMFELVAALKANIFMASYVECSFQ
jgi:hypothetical protein